MADYEPITDKWLETLAREIAIPLQAHPAGPVAQIAQRNASASLNYLVQQYQRLRAALEREQNEHANCEHVNAQRFQTLTDTIIDLTQQVTAMRPMVDALAEVDNSDESACYVVCDLTLYDSANPDEGMRHNEPCIFEQARAFIAEHPAGEAS